MPQFHVGDTNILVSKNAKICITPNVKHKICVIPNAKPQREPMEYRLHLVPNAKCSFAFVTQHAPSLQWNMGLIHCGALHTVMRTLFIFLTFISLLNYIEIFQCIETLLGVEYIYIGLRREKGAGRYYRKHSVADLERRGGGRTLRAPLFLAKIWFPNFTMAHTRYT